MEKSADDRSRRAAVIVSRQEPLLYEYFAEQLATDPTFAVVFDRRVGDRRRAPGESGDERRRTDRRAPASIHGQLTASGFAVLSSPPDRAEPRGGSR